MGLSNRNRHYLRRLALFIGAVIAGSVLPDMGRFIPDKGASHSLLCAFVCVCLALSSGIGFIAGRVLKNFTH